jgi:hypothetical protein
MAKYRLAKDMKEQLVTLENTGGSAWDNLRRQLAPQWPHDMSVSEFADRIYQSHADVQRVLDVLAKETLRMKIDKLLHDSKMLSTTYAVLKEKVFKNPYDDLFDLKHGQEQLQQLYRAVLHLVIEQVRRDYPSAQWNDFADLMRSHFGARVIRHEWWKNLPDESARSYLEMLRERDLEKVKMKLRAATMPLPVLEDAADEESLSLTARKAKFLHQSKSNPQLVPLLGSFMSLVVPNLTTIANQLVRGAHDDQFDQWEAILNKMDANHIVWQMMDRDMSPDDEEILKGLAELNKSAENSERTVQQRILYFWSTYQEDKKTLIMAYLKGVPLK